MPGLLIAIRERVRASDPGLMRLRVAGSAAIAMATALGVELGFAILMHVSARDRLIAMILGAVVAMLGAMALTAGGGDARTKAFTALFFPIAIGAGMILGVAVGGRTDWMLSVFVGVMFVAVFVRRFGPDFYFYGFMFWLGYFFASFLNAKLATMPFFMQAVAIASAWVLALSLSVFRVKPMRTLQRTVRAFDARGRGVLRACAELLQSPGQGDSRAHRRLLRRVHGQERRLAETALIVEACAAQPTALPSARSVSVLRRQLIGAQQALDALVTAAQELAEAGGEDCAMAARIAAQLADRDDVDAELLAREWACATKATTRDPSAAVVDDKLQRSALRFARATEVFVSSARAARQLHVDDADQGKNTADAFEPTAALVMGNLPGSAAVTQGLPARGARWNPLARLDLTSRQAIQVAIAGGIAILAGRALSPERYYWAVIAAFIMFSGTATRSETVLKGFNRVLGTALGLAVAVGLAELTAGHSIATVATIVLSVFCGFYLLRVNYVYTIFFITIMVAQLYTIFHEFTPGLLVLRLEETAIGAGVGFLVALLLMPMSTRDTGRSARRTALANLAKLLDAAATRLAPADDRSDAGGSANAGVGGKYPASLYALSRTFDDGIRRLALVAGPLMHPLLGGGHHVATRHRMNCYVATATNARALVVALGDMDAAAVDQSLADTARALAAAATHLAEAGTDQAGSAVADPLARAEAALDRFDPAAMDGDETGRLVEPLARLRYLLKSLSTVP